MKTVFFSLVILLGVNLSTQLGTSVDLQDIAKLKEVIDHLMQSPVSVKEYMCVVLDIIIPHIKDDEKLKQALLTVKVQLRSPMAATSILRQRKSLGGSRKPYSLDSFDWTQTTNKHMKKINDLIDHFTDQVKNISNERVKVATEPAKFGYGGNKV